MSIARAFVNRPLILLADEPTGNLDPDTSVGIMRLLDRINRTGTTVVMATHDQGIVDTMRRRVIELDRGTIVRDQARGVYGYGDLAHGHSLLEYVANETGNNLLPQRALTLAAVLTVAVSLALVGCSLLLRPGVTERHAAVARRHRAHRLHEPDASPSQIDAIAASSRTCPRSRT